MAAVPLLPPCIMFLHSGRCFSSSFSFLFFFPFHFSPPMITFNEFNTSQRLTAATAPPGTALPLRL